MPNIAQSLTTHIYLQVSWFWQCKLECRCFGLSMAKSRVSWSHLLWVDAQVDDLANLYQVRRIGRPSSRQPAPTCCFIHLDEARVRSVLRWCVVTNFTCAFRHDRLRGVPAWLSTKVTVDLLGSDRLVSSRRSLHISRHQTCELRIESTLLIQGLLIGELMVGVIWFTDRVAEIRKCPRDSSI